MYRNNALIFTCKTILKQYLYTNGGMGSKNEQKPYFGNMAKIQRQLSANISIYANSPMGMAASDKHNIPELTRVYI